MRRAAVNDDWGSCAAGICEPLVARFAKPLCAAHFPLAAALLGIVAKSLRCAAGCSITTLLVLENGGVFRKSESVSWWGWSKRTGGQALWGGGRQQAAMEIRATRGQLCGTCFTTFSHTHRRNWGFSKLERLALKAKSSYLLCYPFCASMRVAGEVM